MLIHIAGSVRIIERSRCESSPLIRPQESKTVIRTELAHVGSIPLRKQRGLRYPRNRGRLLGSSDSPMEWEPSGWRGERYLWIRSIDSPPTLLTCTSKRVSSFLMELQNALTGFTSFASNASTTLLIGIILGFIVCMFVKR